MYMYMYMSIHVTNLAHHTGFIYPCSERVCVFCFSAEFAECGSLYDYLKNIAIEFRQILLWAKQIALGTCTCTCSVHVHYMCT